MMKSLCKNLLLALALLAPAAAPAQQKPAAKPAPAAKAEPAADAAAEGAPAVPERVGPASFSAAGTDLDESQRTVEADRKRDEAIDQLKKIIPKLPAGPQKAGMLFQLAELWIEKSKYVYFNEMNAYDEKTRVYGECVNQKGESACGKEPKPDNQQSELFRDEALRLYEQILKDYPTYERKDEVLFALATNLYEKGTRFEKNQRLAAELVNSSISRYRDLVTQYPQSKFVGDAYVAMGEHYFGANDLTKARKAYDEALVAAKDEPRVYNFALYKLAWCDYNGGAYDDALAKFQKVVELSEASKKKNELALKNEALNDMIQTWQKLEAVEDANAYYKRKSSRKQARSYFTKLANRYADDGSHDLAIKSFRILIGEEPNDPRAPEFQDRIVRAYEGLRQRDKVFEEMKILVKNYKPGSAWAAANSQNKAALAAAYELSEESLRSLVTDYHQEAQKTKEVKTYRLARDIYKEYLDSFSDSDNAYNLNFYYAEILWTLEEWERAAAAYESTYARDGKGSYAKTAAFNALLCYEKLVAISKGELQQSSLKDTDKVDETKKKGNIASGKKKISGGQLALDTKEKEIPQWERKLIEACDRYAVIAAEDKRLEKDELQVRYKAAFLFYDNNHFTEAARRFGDIILKWPTDDQAQKAADLSLNILEVKEEWYELARLSRAFFENKKLAKPGAPWTAQLAKIMEGAQYKYIDIVVYNREQKKDQAAGMFRDFVKEFPKSEYAAQALRYSVIIFNQAKKLDQAIAVGEQLLAEYPECKITVEGKPGTCRADTIWDLAKFYQGTSNFRRAATYYEQFYTEWEVSKGLRPDPKAPKNAKFSAKNADDVIKATKQEEALRVSDALYNAALWFEGLGDFEKAIALYNEYIAKYRSVKGGIPAATLAFNIALIHEKAKAWDKAEKSFDQFVKDYEKTAAATDILYARYKRARILMDRLNKRDDAMKLMQVVFDTFPKLKTEDQKKITYLDAYAHAAFLLVEPQWKAYQAVTFKKLSTLKKDLKTKLELTPKVEASYTKVLQIGSGEWGIAALTRIGQMYQNFAREFLDSPDPPNLDPDQLEMYRAELESRAFPLEDKAVEAYEKALVKAYELGVYNEYSLLAQDALNKFKPNEYGKVRAVSYTGSEFFSGAKPALAIDATFGGSNLTAREVQKDAPAAAPAKKEEKAPEAQPAPEPKKKPKMIMDGAAQQ